MYIHPRVGALTHDRRRYEVELYGAILRFPLSSTFSNSGGPRVADELTEEILLQRDRKGEGFMFGSQ